MRDQLYSSMRFKGDGVTTKVALTFPLEHGENLEVKFGRVIQGEGYVIDYDATPVLVTFSKVLPKGTDIVIRRNTVASSVPYVFQDTGNARGGAEFNAKNIDDNFEHMSKVVIEIDETAERVIDSMEELEDKFDGVLVDFDDVRKLAEGADAKADTAISTANKAAGVANEAKTSAESAVQTAKSAETKADSAVKAAGEANTTSDNALKVAIEANVTAGKANSTASNALTEANKATGIANLAEANSKEATEVAGEAKDIAEGIDDKATEALVKSEEVKAEVSVATTTANEAKEIAQGVEAKADSAIEIAGGADVKAQEALDKVQEGGITERELISKSIGSDKWLREGAFGLGQKGSNSFNFVFPKTSTNVSPTCFVSSPQSLDQEETGAPAREYAGVSISRGVRPVEVGVSGRGSNARLWFRGNTAASPSVVDYNEVLSGNNTRTDKNNVLHSGTSTPLTTLNTSDMSDTVVNRDDLTVTSGAVYRAIDSIPKPDMTEYRKLDNQRFDKGWLAVRAVDSGGANVNFECASGFVRGTVNVTKDKGFSFNQFREGDPLPITYTMPTSGGTLALKSEVTKKADTSYVNTELGKKRDLGNTTFSKSNYANITLNSASVTGVGRNIFIENVNGKLDVIRRFGTGGGESGQTVVSFPNKTGTLALTSDIPQAGTKVRYAKVTLGESISSGGSTLITNPFGNVPAWAVFSKAGDSGVETVALSWASNFDSLIVRSVGTNLHRNSTLHFWTIH